MPKHKATSRNIVTVLARIMGMCLERGEDGKENSRWWAEQINKICDSSDVGDFFGTEGQADPRGDQRD